MKGLIDIELIRSGFINEGAYLVNSNGARYVVKEVQWDCFNPPKFVLRDIQKDTLHGPIFWGKLIDEKWEVESV